MKLPAGTVTFLFTDIEGSTRLLQQVGDQYAEVLSGYREILRSTATSYGGQEIDSPGDACFFAFSRVSDAVAAAVRGGRPEVVVNCAAYTDVDGCETDRNVAFAVNRTGAGHVAAAALAAGAWSKNVSLVPGVNKLFIAALDNTGAILYATNYIVVSELSSTSISGALPSSSTWSPAMGIIHLTSTAVVPTGGTLTIQPGTVVLASPGASIVGTNATINALGTTASAIYFLPSDGTTVWGEVAISGTSGTLLLQHIETILGHVEIFDGAVGTLEDSRLDEEALAQRAG